MEGNMPTGRLHIQFFTRDQSPRFQTSEAASAFPSPTGQAWKDVVYMKPHSVPPTRLLTEASDAQEP